VLAGVVGLGCDSGPDDATLEFDTAVEVGSGVARVQVDVLFVRFKREPDFTHVTIRALTDLDDEHGRRRAAQVSNEARADVQALARELTAPTPGG
jgi:hypothetical protein